MSWRIILFFLLVVPLFVVSQKPTDTVKVKQINYSKLEELFLAKLNEHRKLKLVGVLASDLILKKAALDQSNYMKTSGKVTHDQPTKGKESPYNRVLFYKGIHGGIGENCLKIFIGVSSTTNYSKVPVKNSTYAEVANALFMTWRFSPGHYKNMIEPSYQVTGIDFTFDPLTSSLYSAQVFGRKPAKLPPEFNSDIYAYGITNADGNCGIPSEVEYISTFLSQYLLVQGDSVFQYYRDIDVIKKLINGPKDAIAVDIVKRDQFNCVGEHDLHGSPVFDGHMLKPVYTKELFARNRYVKTAEFYTYVGKLPSFYNPLQYQLNTVLIKGGKSCRYSFPVNTQSQRMATTEVYPLFEKTEGLLLKDSFDFWIKHRIPFERGKTGVAGANLRLLLRKVNLYKAYADQIKIETFSSIDGNEQVNEKLQKERAENIRTHLLPYFQGKIDWNVESKENWDSFYEQLKDSRMDHLAGLTKEEIRSRLKDPSFLFIIEDLLNKQREALVLIHVKGVYKDIANPPLSVIAFNNTVSKGNPDQSWIALSHMIHHHLKGDILLNEMNSFNVPLTKEFLPVLSNVVGLNCFEDNFALRLSNVKYLKAAYRLDTNRYTMRFNYSLFLLKYWETTGFPEENPVVLEERIKSLYKNAVDEMEVDRLLLNYHVLAAEYFYEKKKFKDLEYSLQEIGRIFPHLKITEEEAYSLALMFNYYFRFDWSIKIMLPFMEKGNCAEDFVFLFVRTGALYSFGYEKEDYLKYLKKARSMNPIRFCNWINKEDFQLLRDPLFQKEYCENCKEN